MSGNRGPTFGMPCMACGIATEEQDGYTCTTQGCPCWGTAPGTREAGVAAARWQAGRAAYAEPGYRDPRAAAWNAADMAEARSARPARPARTRQAPAEDPLTAYERGRAEAEAEADYHRAYQQAKADAELHGLYIAAVRHRRSS